MGGSGKGNGGALGNAWLQAGLLDELYVVDPSLPSDSELRCFSRLNDLPDVCFDLIILAVKPAYATSAIAELRDSHCQQATVLSVVAGVTQSTLLQALKRRCPVVRVMPNTPVLVGAGCTGLFAGKFVEAGRKDLIDRLFKTVGSTCWVEREQLLDAVTAISGSGPAYYHLFSEALAQAGIKLGLPKELAEHLAAQTAFGAAKLQQQPLVDFSELRIAVTSPNGTTAAAIEVLESDQKLRKLIEQATEAAYRRSFELSGNL